MSLYAGIGGTFMTDRKAQIETLWTYEISKEKVLKRLVKKGFMAQAEADQLSEKLLEQLDTGKIFGFRLSSLEEKDACQWFMSQSICFHNGNC